MNHVPGHANALSSSKHACGNSTRISRWRQQRHHRRPSATKERSCTAHECDQISTQSMNGKAVGERRVGSESVNGSMTTCAHLLHQRASLTPSQEIKLASLRHELAAKHSKIACIKRERYKPRMAQTSCNTNLMQGVLGCQSQQRKVRSMQSVHQQRCATDVIDRIKPWDNCW